MLLLLLLLFSVNTVEVPFVRGVAVGVFRVVVSEQRELSAKQKHDSMGNVVENLPV